MLLATTIPGNIKIDVRTPALHETPALVEAESDKENAMDTGTSRQNGVCFELHPQRKSSAALCVRALCAWP
jgi:hypothetical protein